ncbi:carbohydrate ABC transporter permease [Clostridium sediminicola]|uniref:carbohydrate ABC transporter permease n=1 Tax=Clostridium sediminicola TaxID=3114879 RepID=UPI0031F20EF6
MEKKKSDGKGLLYVKRIICYLTLIFLTIMCLFSFYILIVNATRAHSDIQKGFSFLPGKSFMVNLKNILKNQNLPVLHGIINSLFISTCCAVLTTYFSAMTAYAIHSYEFRFKKAAFLFIMLVMMVPTQVSALGFIGLITKMKLMDNYVPLIVPSIAAPIVFFFMKQYMESNLPIEIIEAARIDGSGEFNTFNRIVLPIIKPAIAVQAIFSFVSSWNNYFIPSLVIKTNEKKTLPILIAQLRSADFLKFDMGQVYIMIAIAIIPVMIVYFFLSKFIVRGIAVGSLKG